MASCKLWIIEFFLNQLLRNGYDIVEQLQHCRTVATLQNGCDMQNGCDITDLYYNYNSKICNIADFKNQLQTHP